MRGTIDMIVLEKCSADFFILDDSKYLKLDKSEQSMIFRFMEYLDKKRISVKIITIDGWQGIICTNERVFCRKGSKRYYM